MAIDSTGTASREASADRADKAIFPDGYKTSGQHGPVESLLRRYEDFPREISGPTVWRAEDYRDNRDRWTHAFTEDEISEIGAASDRFIASGLPLTAMTKDAFELPRLAARMASLRQTLVDGQGFWLFKNLPVREWSLKKSGTAYMGLGAHLGYFVSQNGHGHVLGHVKDLGEDPTQTDRVRIYRTNARQFFHTDAADLVGLLCIARSMEGGESDIVSTHHVWNTLQRENPDVARTLTEPIWYQDRKGEISEGEEPWIRTALVLLENKAAGGDGNDDDTNNPAAAAATPRLYGKFDPNNFTSLKRFSTGPGARIPPLSEAQLRALRVVEDTCKRESLHMVLDPGDIQFLANTHVYHARTAYRDWAPGAVDDRTGEPRPRRHLMRLWLSVPLAEGGWRLPYPDAHLKKRGGIQVNDNPPTCPLDAE